MALWNRLRSAVGFSYDAAADSNKRKPGAYVLQAEDAELPPEKKKRLIAGSRELQRNFAIAKWMVARHLDYVTTFSFQAKTGNDALDDRLEALMAEQSGRLNCDIAGRHSLAKMIRLAEARRIIDGDLFLVRLASKHLQAIEGDRVRNPIASDTNWRPTLDANGEKLRQWIAGVEVDRVGRMLNVAVCRRGDGPDTFHLDRVIRGEHVYQHAHFERFDQVRGITPMSSAFNTLRDTYEGFDYARAKMKVAQLFGLKIFRESAEDLGIYEPLESPAMPGDEQTPAEQQKRYQIDFGKGPFLLDLDPGDSAEFMESKSPSTEFQAFSQTMIAVALKSLNIPYSFFDESFTNYSGSRGAILQYERSAKVDRSEVRNLLDWVTLWWIVHWMHEGLLPGASIEQIAFDHVPLGQPWLDPLKEVTAELFSIDSGLDNYEDIAQRHGTNFYENIDKNARCRAYAESKSVPLSTMKQIWVPTGNEQESSPVAKA